MHERFVLFLMITLYFLRRHIWTLCSVNKLVNNERNVTLSLSLSAPVDYFLLLRGLRSWWGRHWLEFAGSGCRGTISNLFPRRQRLEVAGG